MEPGPFRFPIFRKRGLFGGIFEDKEIASIFFKEINSTNQEMQTMCQ